MKSFTLGLLIAAALAAEQRVEVTLERRDAGTWKSADPDHVFAFGDQVRFRFKSNFSGFLYVVNEGTSGDATQFPSTEAGTDNRVEAGREYLIPGNQGAFRLTGPVGFDTVYWIISPVRLGSEAPKHEPLPAPPAPGAAPPNMQPRCDDAILPAPALANSFSLGRKNAWPSRAPRRAPDPSPTSSALPIVKSGSSM